MVTVHDFRTELIKIFNEAEKKGLQFIEVRSGDLHSSLGAISRMPSCCDAMHGLYDPLNDVIVKIPPKGKGANLIISYHIPRNVTPRTALKEKDDIHPQSHPWFWEGNVQRTLRTNLVKEGYQIIKIANTETRESGKDIEAITPDGKTMWVSVKGWPEKSSNTQARHWFSQALFDIILYRDESNDTELALAFPDGYPTYLNLAKRIKWFKDTARFKIFWISEHGLIRV